MAHDVFEEFRASGKELVDKARDILEEGNVRRMIIKNGRDETLLEVPLTLGVIGVGGAFALAPILSSIAAFAFFVHDARILVERDPKGGKAGSGPRKRKKGRPLHNDLRDEDPAETDEGGSGRKSNRKTTRGGFGPGRHRNRDDYRDPFEIDARFEVLR